MASQHQPIPDLWALLIGIDCYMPNQLPDGTYYLNLAGCVRDVRMTEQYLRSEFGLTDERLTRLTASCGDDMKPSESPNELPTYSNIVQAFRKLEESAQPGEQIYIHYSGHGGKVKTLPKHRVLIPHKKIDEALVPTDLGNDEGRYLRDIELAFLLQRLVDKGLYVTIVLDSCHAGSATRGFSTVRGTGTVDTVNRSSLVASDKELADNWLRLPPERVARDVDVSSEWLPDPRGYVLLAACRSHEAAHEYAFDQMNKHGALTYWLLESFNKFGDGATYSTLHRYIHAKVSQKFFGLQHPQLEGEGDRLVFGREPIPAPFAFDVRDVDEANRQVTLSAGTVHALGAGARFALYSAGQAEFKRSDTPLALAETIKPGMTSSVARVVNGPLHGHIELGDRAVLLAPGTDTPRFTVRVLNSDGMTQESPQTVAVERVIQHLRGHNEGYVQLAEGDDAPDFLTTVTPGGHFSICDSSGVEIPNITPALCVADPGAPRLVVERLLHLAKYRSARELKNFDPLSPLSRKFSVELMGVQADYKPGDPIRPQKFAKTQDTPAVKAGEWIFLLARNHYTNKEDVTLNVTVLNLRPDWSIKQVFPSRSGLFDTLEPEQELPLPLRVGLPPSYNEGIDFIKFFATIQPADFHFLELPPLDHVAREAATREEISRGSDYDDESQTRDMVVPLNDADDWNTRQFEIRVTR